MAHLLLSVEPECYAGELVNDNESQIETWWPVKIRQRPFVFQAIGGNFKIVRDRSNAFFLLFSLMTAWVVSQAQ